MRKSMIVATMLATSALTVAFSGGADAGRYNARAASQSESEAPYASHDGKRKLNDQAIRSYKADRERRRTVAYKRLKRERSYAYPFGPWGPFAGPPGLF